MKDANKRMLVQGAGLILLWLPLIIFASLALGMLHDGPPEKIIACNEILPDNMYMPLTNHGPRW